MAAPVDYAPRFDSADLIQRGLTTLLRCPVYRDSQLAEPSMGTVSIYDDSSVAIVSAASVTITDKIATYSLAGATTAGLELARGWRIEWLLTMPDAVAHTYRNEAGLVRCVPFPVVSDQTLYRRVPALDPAGPAPLTRYGSYQGFIDEAWTMLRNRLDETGTRVELVVTPARLREPHLLAALMLIFQDLASRNPAHQAAADSYAKQYEAAWARSSVELDTDEDGDGDTVRPTRPPLWAM